MPRSRLGTAVYLILVFASGILVGIVSYRLYDAKTVTATAAAPRTMEQYRKQFLNEMRQKVGTNEAQTAQITQVLDDTKHKLDLLHEQEKPLREKLDRERIENIRAILTDPQKTAYDQWRADRAAEQLRKKQQAKN
ncbi:MAG: hypothetical protein M3N54_00795 [Acidobacteriota bacterium]|nr:hypothetical protein [Acidobacteriota bacterium]